MSSSKRVVDDSDEDEDLKSKQAASFFDNEADESGEDAKSNEEDEEEEEASDNDYKKDGFVVSDGEDDDEEEESSKRKKKKHRFKRNKRVKLDDDDLLLVSQAQQDQSKVVVAEEDDEDDEDSFIVDDDEDEFDGDQKLESKKTRKKKKSTFEDQIQLENDTDFGAIFNHRGFFDSQEDEEDDDESVTKERPVKETRLADSYEYATQAENYMLASDESIVKLDIPERTQIFERSLRLERKDDDSRGEFFLQYLEEEEEQERFGEGYEMLVRASNPIERARTAQSNWVLSQLTQQYESRHEIFEATEESVKNALKLLQREDLEVPFIHIYRRNMVHPLQLEDLWAIVEHSYRYVKLIRQRKSLKQIIEKTIPNDLMDEETALGEDHLGAKSVQAVLLERVDAAESLDQETLGDILNFVSFKYGEAAEQVDASQDDDAHSEVDAFENDSDDDEDDEDRSKSLMALRTKAEKVKNEGMVKVQRKVKRRSENRKANYLKLREYNLEEFCHKVVSIPRLAASIDAGRRIFLVQDDVGDDPSALALLAIGQELSSEEKIVRVATLNLSVEIMHEPRVRAYMRGLYRTMGKLSTKLTVKGRQVIATDPLHEYYGISSLNNKPFNAFLEKNESDPKQDYRDQILLIRKAEKEGFLLKKINRAELTVHLLLSLSEYMLTEEGVGRVKIGTQLEEVEGELKIRFPNPDVFDEWDRIRFNVLKHCILNCLLPYLEQRMMKELDKHAEERVLRLCGIHAWKLATRAPVAFPVSGTPVILPNHLRVKSTKCRVMAAYLTDEMREPNYAVVLDESGFVLDYVGMPSISKRNEVETRLNEMIDRLSPHFVVLNGSAGMRIRGIFMGLEKRAIQQAENARGPSRKGGSYETDEELSIRNPDQVFIPMIMDDTLASVVASGAVRMKEFKEYHMHLRKSIAMGRCMQNQLSELCAIWTDISRGDNMNMEKSEMLTLTMHPLQGELRSSALLRVIHQVLVTAVAMNGVDVNHLVRSAHSRTVLPFVPGLGFRKALSLIQEMDRGGRNITSRFQLIECIEKSLVSDDTGESRVVRNAIGFLSTASRANDPLDFENATSEDLENFHGLDQTRIHPELNSIAVYMSWKARYGDRKQMPQLDDDGTIPPEVARCVYKTMRKSREALNKLLTEDPEWISRYGEAHWTPFYREFALPSSSSSTWDLIGDEIGKLDLDEVLEEFASLPKHLADYNDVDKQSLSFCKSEFQFPFQGYQLPCKPLTPTETFDLLTGENDESLMPGTDLMAKIFRIRGNWVEVRLSSGVNGSIYITELSNERVPDHLMRPGEPYDERDTIEAWMEETLGLSVGSDVAARVIEVNKERFSCKLTARASVLDKLPHVQLEDPWWKRPETLNERKDARRGRGRTADGVLKRPISHPAFHNMTRSEAEARLKDKPIGDCIIRPSSQGLLQLTVTWKVSESPHLLFQHFLVSESGKKPTDTKLGTPLKVKDLVFEDLDELLERYLSPVADFMKDVYKFRYFKYKTKYSIQEDCRQSKAQEAKRIPYFIVPNEEHPGYFMMYYQPGTSVRKVGISVTPDGFKLQTTVNGKVPEVMNSLDAVIAYFKSNFAKFGVQPSSSRYSNNSSSRDRYSSSRDRYSESRDYDDRGYNDRRGGDRDYRQSSSSSHYY